MTSDMVKKKALILIKAHDGEWGWYQLDRALAQIGMVNCGIPELVKELVRDGLVSLSGDPELASTRFSLTPEGVSSCGNETLDAD